MPKMKTRRAVAKRFSKTANGKLKRKKANLRHLLTAKSTSAKKRAGKTAYVSSADQKKIMKCLPYA